MFRIITIAIVTSVFCSSMAYADADDRPGYPFYYQTYQSYQTAPVVQEEIIITPNGIIEEEIVYAQPRYSNYPQIVQQQYATPAPVYYGNRQMVPVYRWGDWDD